MTPSVSSRDSDAHNETRRTPTADQPLYQYIQLCGRLPKNGGRGGGDLEGRMCGCRASARVVVVRLLPRSLTGQAVLATAHSLSGCVRPGPQGRRKPPSLGFRESEWAAGPRAASAAIEDRHGDARSQVSQPAACAPYGHWWRAPSETVTKPCLHEDQRDVSHDE
jgi:hypothetical protein